MKYILIIVFGGWGSNDRVVEFQTIDLCQKAKPVIVESYSSWLGPKAPRIIGCIQIRKETGQ